tara:strand:+ start:2221 stop:2916 length:696 start_codon:yes stop_codon:yes gene_type:complete
MNKLLTALAIAFLGGIAVIFAAKAFSRIEHFKSTPVVQEPRQLPPIDKAPPADVPPLIPILPPEDLKPDDLRTTPRNKWENTANVVTTSSFLVPHRTLTIPANTSETWLIAPNRSIVCGIFYAVDTKDRALVKGTELTVEWVRSGVVTLPGNRQSSKNQECVIKCHTEGGTEFYLLMVAGRGMSLHGVPGSLFQRRWSGTNIHSPTVEETEQLWAILLSPPEPIKVPWPPR